MSLASCGCCSFGTLDRTIEPVGFAASRLRCKDEPFHLEPEGEFLEPLVHLHAFERVEIAPRSGKGVARGGRGVEMCLANKGCYAGRHVSFGATVRVGKHRHGFAKSLFESRLRVAYLTPCVSFT